MIGLPTKGGTGGMPLVPPVNLNTVRQNEFFTELYGEMPQDLSVVFWRKSNKLSSSVPLSELDTVISHLLEPTNVADLYFGIGLQKQLSTRAGNSRGTARDIVAIPGLWADIDCSHGSHTQTKLPTSKEAIEFLSNLPFGYPSIIVDTGGGYHAYWLFREPWIFDDEEERGEAEKLSFGFQSIIKELGNRQGWNLDITADLARILRVPGTFNGKRHTWEEVRVIHCNSNIRYNPGEFEPYLLDIKSYPSAVKQNKAGHIHLDVNWALLSSKCAWLKHCEDDAEHLPEPEWFALLTILAKCSTGSKWAHKLSKPYPRYCPTETDQKLKHAASFGNAYGCHKISQITTGYCNDCIYQNGVTTPLEILQAREAQTQLSELGEFLKTKEGDIYAK